jgi:hypothetical protein
MAALVEFFYRQEGALMTEAEWLACANPEAMLRFLQKFDSARKLRLFACACCRLRWKWLPLEECKAAVDLAECFAGGLITRSELMHLRREARWAIHRAPDARSYAAAAAVQTLSLKAATAARRAAELLRKQRGTQTTVPKAFRGRVLAFAEQAVAKAAWDKACAHSERKEAGEQAAILRDIFGNPFRSITFDASFVTAKVAKLARAIYAERAFDRLPELADALKQAGCADPDILEHCHESQQHFLGCWLVDKLNGKA